MTKLAAHVQETSDTAAEHLRRALYPAIKCMGNTTPAWLREKVLPEYDRCGVPRPFIWRRQWTDDKRDEWVRAGKMGARAFFDHAASAYDAWADLTLVVEGINEFVAWSVEDMRWLNEFDAEAAMIWQAHGRQYIGGNWSVGHPDLALWPEYRDALGRMDFLGLHMYGWPEGVAEDGVPFLWHPWRVFRYQKVRQTILENNMRLPPILLTEVGWARGVWNGDLGDVGFKRSPDPNAYFAWLTGFDSRITSDADVLYASIFQTGAKADWRERGFDIVGHYVGNVLADYTRVDALTLPPEPPPYAPGPPSDDEIRNLASNSLGIPYTPGHAFPSYARAHGLGAPLGSTFDRRGLRIQAFMGGVVTCVLAPNPEDTDWSKTTHIKW